ncbi:MAG: polysaccharide pyruvyl transferase family protein [Alphaproteobacteria bacterium]|nr:MAG: polysaccharide pyruvyl transferase family protein [Alphaproteobacteria bacterium]
MKIVLMDLWTDANKGDEALQGGLISMLRDKHRKAKLVGVFRFGLNEFEDAKPEIQKTLGLLDEAHGGLRKTLYAGSNALKLKGAVHLLFSLYSFAELLVLLAMYKLGLRALVPAKFRIVMDDIHTADAVVWKGKNFRSYGGLGGINRQATLLIAGVISRVLNPRVFCVNASIWNMNSGVERWMVKSVLNFCQSVCVRDAGSLVAAKALGIKNYFFAHDLSFYYLNILASKEKVKREKGAMALTITKWGSAKANEQYIKSVVAAVLALVDKGITDVYVVPQVIRVAEANDVLIERLNADIKASGKSCVVHNIEEELTIPQLMQYYARCSVLVGTRMHSCVFSRFVGTPFVGIAYDDGPKWDILREFWPKDLIVPYGVSEADLVEKSLRAYTNGPALIKASEAAFSELPAHSYKNVRDI